ncbi:small-conductance mechanosensitive channel [Lachnospiraceae bacterium KM106-2]|nr:small-conductance mechanosensitive channel [Lachnospiraceae bacterium KM106-2]
MQFLTSNGVDVSSTLNQVKDNLEKGKIQTYLDDNLFPGLINFAQLLLLAIIVYFVGKKLIKWILKFVKVSLEKSSLEEGATGFLIVLIKATLYTVLLISIAGIVGIQTSSFIALLGSAGVAIGLALQGTLSNLAGGVLILVTKPFRVGDYIMVSGKEGTVISIDICYTRLATIDNKIVVMPNGQLTNQNIVNVTSEPTRRLDLIIPVAYEENLERVKQALLEVVRSSELVLPEEEIQVFLYSFDSSSISVAVRVWTETDNYWPLKWEMQEKVKNKFDQEGISIPYNQLDVKVVHDENIRK